MTQEQKDLLLKDLCARLPYGVKIFVDIDKEFDGGHISTFESIQPYKGKKYPSLNGEYLLYDAGGLTPLTIEEVRPMLRPMSSMTDEEDKEICQFMKDYNLLPGSNKAGVFCGEIVDWLNAHHFDYHDLIPKGLAIEVTEENNPYKK